MKGVFLCATSQTPGPGPSWRWSPCYRVGENSGSAQQKHWPTLLSVWKAAERDWSNSDPHFQDCSLAWLVSVCTSSSPTARRPHPQPSVQHHEWCGDLWELSTEQHLAGLPTSYLLSLPPLYSPLQVLLIGFISNGQRVRLSPLPQQQSLLPCDSLGNALCSHKCNHHPHPLHWYFWSLSLRKAWFMISAVSRWNPCFPHIYSGQYSL